MTHRHPLPLHVLPAFDAAARHGSFRAAAEELHLTPSAISHQIRTLEEALGVKLFLRFPGGLALSDAGRSYARTVRDALGRLKADAERLGAAGATRRVRVSMPDFVAHLYVMPQLPELRARHAELELEITTGFGLRDLESGTVDAAIRIGGGSWAELESHLISPLAATFVASPELAASARRLSDAGRLPVVSLKDHEALTRESLVRADLVAGASPMLCVDSCMGLLQAAEEGLGVAVLYLPPARAFESTERLTRLPGNPVPVPFSLYFVHRHAEAERPDIRVLRDWVLDPSWSRSRTRPPGRAARNGADDPRPG